MEFEHVYSEYFEKQEGVAIFYSSSEDFCPEVAFLSESGELDYGLQELTVKEFEILGANKYPVVVVQYDMPMPRDLDPKELIEFITQENRDRGFRFWVYLLENPKLKTLMDNFTAHYLDRIGIRMDPEDSRNPSMILEAKKGELLTCLFFTRQPLSKHFHSISNCAD